MDLSAEMNPEALGRLTEFMLTESAKLADQYTLNESLRELSRPGSISLDCKVKVTKEGRELISWLYNDFVEESPITLDELLRIEKSLPRFIMLEKPWISITQPVQRRREFEI